jgi:energy-coupling factor transport system ATP-binding protein
MQVEITLSAVSFAYSGQPVFTGLDWSLDGCRATGLSGPAGSGKTTLGKLILGLLRPAGGCVFLDRTPVQKIPLWQIGSRIGYLFQDFSCQLFAGTVLEELALPFELMGRREPDLASRCRQLLDELRFRPPLDAATLRLSMGERQRLALATLLIRDPAYLILDEPTASLDAPSTATLLQILREKMAQGVGMLVISHDQDFLDALCDEQWQIQQGTIVKSAGVGLAARTAAVAGGDAV